jgi:hypothetical protein
MGIGAGPGHEEIVTTTMIRETNQV